MFLCDNSVRRKEATNLKRVDYRRGWRDGRELEKKSDYALIKNLYLKLFNKGS